MSEIIISDFDGTITQTDVNNTIHFHYGDEKTAEIEEQFSRGEIGVYQSLSFHYNRLKISEKEFKEFVLENIEIDPYFKKFYKMINNKDLDFAVISGGFINYIEMIFDKYNIDMKHPIYANKLLFKENNNIEVKFAHEVSQKECIRDSGYCGNCKYRIINKYKNQKNKDKIIYIGDGLTDRCGARQADIILVKSGSSLLDYCQDNNIEYYVFNNFKEIKEIIKELIFNKK